MKMTSADRDRKAFRATRMASHLVYPPASFFSRIAGIFTNPTTNQLQCKSSSLMRTRMQIAEGEEQSLNHGALRNPCSQHREPLCVTGDCRSGILSGLAVERDDEQLASPTWITSARSRANGSSLNRVHRTPLTWCQPWRMIRTEDITGSLTPIRTVMLSNPPV